MVVNPPNALDYFSRGCAARVVDTAMAEPVLIGSQERILATAKRLAVFAAGSIGNLADPLVQGVGSVIVGGYLCRGMMCPSSGVVFSLRLTESSAGSRNAGHR